MHYRTFLLARKLTLCACLAMALAATQPPTPADSRGPIAHVGMNVVADAQGVYVPGYRFDNHCTKPTPWQAKWIWLTDPAPGAGVFRKEVVLAESPRQALAWMTADIKCRLWINGRLAWRGPVDMGSDFAGGLTHRWFYDFRDLTPFFRKGRNVIAAEVFQRWPIGHTVSRGQPGLLFEASIDGQTVKTDASWRANAEPDAGAWEQPDFNDSAWPAAREVKDVWAPLVASEIPPLMEARYPVARVEGLDNKTFGKDGAFRVVFDRVLSGYPQLKVKGGAGATVTLKAHRQAVFKLDGSEQTLEFPFMTEIAPAFTVEIKDVKSPVQVLDVGAVFTSQPVDYRGAFECSDDRLNQIWNVSRWAVQICLQTHHLDSPNHQEPISDPGDYLIESMVNHYAFAQPWLARQDLRKFAWLLKDENYHNFHTSYSIGWLQMLMDYYDYTGDKTLVDELAPTVHELLDTYATWRGKNGLISEAPNYMFMDWVTIGGFACHHPPAVIGQGYLTAFYYHGLDMASRVAELTGDSARLAKYAALRQEIALAFNRELWVADQGLYRDGKPFQTSVKPYNWLPADKEIETFSPHVNLLAVLYDLAPKQRQGAIVDKIMAQTPLNTQPWFMHWVFAAIDHAGLFDKYGTWQMRRWQIVPETQSFHEMWHGGDLSHGWCSTPLVQMFARVLGVTPTSPGFKTMAIRPTVCDLTWAKGVVPTPHGDVRVGWTWGNDVLKLEVSLPEGTQADVILPSRTEHVGAGVRTFETPYKRAAQPATCEVASGSSEDLEVDLVKDDLVHRYLARAEDHCSHAGGGKNADALFNGTTHNGQGGTETRDDGKTFRGYAAGDWLNIQLTQPCDLTEIRTFAGHSDGRASQAYTVLVATQAAPGKFVKIASANKPGDGGMSEVRLPVKAAKVVAIRFEFENGPLGFNVYREMNLVGRESLAH